MSSGYCLIVLLSLRGRGLDCIGSVTANGICVKGDSSCGQPASL